MVNTGANTTRYETPMLTSWIVGASSPCFCYAAEPKIDHPGAPQSGKRYPRYPEHTDTALSPTTSSSPRSVVVRSRRRSSWLSGGKGGCLLNIEDLKAQQLAEVAETERCGSSSVASPSETSTRRTLPLSWCSFISSCVYHKHLFGPRIFPLSARTSRSEGIAGCVQTSYVHRFLWAPAVHKKTSGPSSARPPPWPLGQGVSDRGATSLSELPLIGFPSTRLSRGKKKGGGSNSLGL
jgi:hypothetical protein